MKRVFFIPLSSIFLGCFWGCSTTQIKHNENYYQRKLCEKLGGVMEYRLADTTRVDCLTERYAIEVDFAKKWAESIGQSLYYAKMTGKKPAIALIVGERDARFLKRLHQVSDRCNIDIFILKKEH